MSRADFAWIFFGVLLNAAAQLLLKAGASTAGAITLDVGSAALWRIAAALAQHPFVLTGLGCYVVSVVVWIVALSRVDVSIAYPMLSIGYVVNALLAWWLFGEDVNAQRWLGMAAIIVGVVLVARSGGHS